MNLEEIEIPVGFRSEDDSLLIDLDSVSSEESSVMQVIARAIDEEKEPQAVLETPEATASAKTNASSSYHFRFDCPENRKSPRHSFCSNCICFLCNVQVSKCPYWKGDKYRHAFCSRIPSKADSYLLVKRYRAMKAAGQWTSSLTPLDSGFVKEIFKVPPCHKSSAAVTTERRSPARVPSPYLIQRADRIVRNNRRMLNLGLICPQQVAQTEAEELRRLREYSSVDAGNSNEDDNTADSDWEPDQMGVVTP